MTHDVRELFERYRGTLGGIAAAVKAALDTDPDAGLSQDDRLRAWCTASTQFCDPAYWQQAVDVHAATVRARNAEHDRIAAETVASEQQAAHAAAQRDASERAGQLAVTHPHKRY